MGRGWGGLIIPNPRPPTLNYRFEIQILSSHLDNISQLAQITNAQI